MAVVVVVYWRFVVGGCWEGVEVEDIEQRLTKGVPRDVRVGVNERAEFHVTSTKKHSWTRNKGVRRLTAVKMFTCMYLLYFVFWELSLIAHLPRPFILKRGFGSPVLYEHRDEDGHGIWLSLRLARDW